MSAGIGLENKVIAERFEIENLIGQGAMGSVYRGKDLQTGERVAIKALKTDFTADKPELVERFIREGEALRKLNHPNIVRMLANAEENGQHYLVMEYVDGGSLYDLLKKSPQIPIRQVLSLALELSDALTRAHHLDIIHRDIKPANILLAKDGTPRLSDFGVAHIEGKEAVTQTGMVIGTFAYLSPEALNGDPVDPRADIWAFGILLYEMLAGRKPFTDEKVGTLLTSILSNPIPSLSLFRPDAPPALIYLIEQMLVKEPRGRINSMRLIGAELEALLKGQQSRITTQNAEPIQVSTLTSMASPPSTDEMTPLSTTAVAPVHDNLPAQITPLVGRETAVAALKDYLSDPEKRLITLLGAGGMGKTRVALEVAASQIPNFKDGVYFVSLAALETCEFLVTTIGEAIGFTFYGQDEPHVQLLNYLREKHILLVMDSFEHLISGADLIIEILKAAPGVQVLATSREKLNLRGETLYRIEAMDLPPADVALDDLKPDDYSAIALFIQSARQTLSDFDVTDDNKADIIQICRMVEGIPLAIELAAAWLEMLEAHEILDEIKSNIDFLETEMRDVPERHRSMRAVFEYSWNLLSAEEQVFYVKLSVFRGGFERKAAQKIAGASIRQLTPLVNKSLLKRQDDGRYVLHGMLYQYAVEKLEERPEKKAKLRESHAEYYLHFLHERESLFYTPKHNATVEEIEAEIQNIRHAWDWAVEHKKTQLLQIALNGLGKFYQARSLYMEAAEAFGKAFQALAPLKDEADYRAIYGQLIVWKSSTITFLGKYQYALQMVEEGLQIARELDDKAAIGQALMVVCYALMWQGKYKRAKEVGQESIDIFRALNDPFSLSRALGNQGYVHYLSGEYEEAKRYTEEARSVGESSQNTFIYGFAYNNLGEIHQAMGNFREARALYEKAYDFFKSIRNRRGMAFTLNNLGGTEFALRDLENAERHYRKGYRLNKEIGDRAGLGHSLSALGNLAYIRKDTKKAQDFYQQSYDIRKATGDPRSIADSLSDLGNVALALGKVEEARQYKEESMKLRREIGDLRGLGESLLSLSGLEALEGNGERARELVKEAFEIGQELNDMFNQGWAYLLQIFFDLEDKKLEDARTKAKEILRIAEGRSTPLAETIGQGLYSMIEYMDGNVGAARKYLAKAINSSEKPQFFNVTVMPAYLLAKMLYGSSKDPKYRAKSATLMAAIEEQPLTYLTIVPRIHARKLLKNLKEELPSDIYEAAIERGKKENVHDLFKEMMTICNKIDIKSV